MKSGNNLINFKKQMQGSSETIWMTNANMLTKVLLSFKKLPVSAIIMNFSKTNKQQFNY